MLCLQDETINGNAWGTYILHAAFSIAGSEVHTATCKKCSVLWDIILSTLVELTDLSEEQIWLAT
jgi:hypothetical protein